MYVQGITVNVKLLSLLNQNKSLLISSGSALTFNYFGQNIGQVIDVFAALRDINCFPKLTIPWISSLFLSFTSLLKCSFKSSCHKFSIGLQSGDSFGVCHQFTPLSWTSVHLDTMFESLAAGFAPGCWHMPQHPYSLQIYTLQIGPSYLWLPSCEP